jgi:hypothetical protein
MDLGNSASPPWPPEWVYVQILSGRILIDRQPSGAYLFDDTPETVDILLGLRNRAVTRVDLRTRQLAQEGQCHE